MKIWPRSTEGIASLSICYEIASVLTCLQDTVFTLYRSHKPCYTIRNSLSSPCNGKADTMSCKKLSEADTVMNKMLSKDVQ